MKNFEVYVVLLLLVIIAIMALGLVYAHKAYKELMAKADDLNGKSNSIMGLAGNFLKRFQ